MTKTYRVNAATRIINGAFGLMTRLGLGERYRHNLAVGGRKTGRVYSTPVDVIEHEGARYLVAAYGVVNWVRNVRASGEAALSRGRQRETVKVTEVIGRGAVPVLRRYFEQVPVTRDYFGFGASSSDDDVLRGLANHPVFRVDVGDRRPAA